MNAVRDQGVTALIVDASQFQRSLLSGIARSAGVDRVILAQSSDEAFEMLVDNNPNLVIADYAMGPQGAVAFARRVRRGIEAPNRAVAMIVLMARATRADVEAAREAGVDAVLMKPCSPAMLQEKIAIITAEGRPFVVSAEYVGPCRRWRSDPSYRGPMRRLSDPNAVENNAESDLYCPPGALLEALSRLSAAAMTMDRVGSGAQNVRNRTLHVKAVALDSGDNDVAEGAHELLRYLDAVGATNRLSAHAVQVHIEALNQIVALPPTDRAMRMRLGDGLKRLVAKKLIATIAS